MEETVSGKREIKEVICQLQDEHMGIQKAVSDLLIMIDNNLYKANDHLFKNTIKTLQTAFPVHFVTENQLFDFSIENFRMMQGGPSSDAQEERERHALVSKLETFRKIGAVMISSLVDVDFSNFDFSDKKKMASFRLLLKELENRIDYEESVLQMM